MAHNPEATVGTQGTSHAGPPTGSSQVHKPRGREDRGGAAGQGHPRGAAGSEVIIDMFDDETLAFLRQQSLLINEANLVFYVDGEQDFVPNKMFLYKYDFNSMINDLYNFRFGPLVFGGNLVYDDEGNPELYKFRITDYLTKMIKGDEPIALSRLAIRNSLDTDGLNTSVLDTVVQKWNYIPKGVVLHGNRPADNNKRIKLEIFYSQ